MNALDFVIARIENKIHQLTLRGGANFMVVSPTVATILESIPGFAADTDGAADTMKYAFGVQKIGQLNSRYKVYNSKPNPQQQSFVQTFGTEDPVIKPDRGALSTAWHYTGGAVWNAGSKLMAGLQNVSDFTTRLYRTAAIGTTQGMGLADAWDEANDKGDKVFNPGRISDARAKFGNTAVTIAMRIAAGEEPEKIIASATPEEQKYVRLAYKKTGTQAEQDLFQDTIDAVGSWRRP